MSKTYLRASKASGSTRRKVESLIIRGWQPGLPAKIGPTRRQQRRQQRQESYGG